MGNKKTSKPNKASSKANTNTDLQANLGKNNDGTPATSIGDDSQAETGEVTATQNEPEAPVANQDEKKQKSNKPKICLMEIIARRLGYVKRDKVALWITDIYKKIAAEEDMDEKTFAELSLKKKFEALTEGIEKLREIHAQELEFANAAVAKAENLAERETQAKSEAQAKAEASERRANEAENRATAAEEKANSAETERKNLQNRMAEMNTMATFEQKKSVKYESDINALKKENTDLYNKIDTYDKDLKATKEKYACLLTTNEELDGNFKKLQAEHANLQSKHISLQDNYDICKARCEELEASEVGHLTEIIKAKNETIISLNADKAAVEAVQKQIEAAKKVVDKQLEEARQAIETRDGELKTERNTTKELRLMVKAHEKKIEALTEQNGQFAAKIEKQEANLEACHTTINEKVTEIKSLNDDNDSLRIEITGLKKSIDGLEQAKATLAAANETARQQLGEKTDFIRAERDDFAHKMMMLAKSLSEATAKDFLGCCDDDFESNRINLQEKVLKPVRAFEREMAEINPNDYGSRDELAVAYHALIKAQFDEASGLTRIAQWYAYSQVPFMVDEERSDGLFIRQQEIRNIYTLAVRLMGNVGIEYSLPALYTERLLENGTYVDVTGQRQLNIEYMCPTARNHKENIDCIDSSQVIIDVVEVGYTDDKGNSKKSQVII